LVQVEEARIVRSFLGAAVASLFILVACGKSSGGSASGGGPSHPPSGGTATVTINSRNVPGVGTVLVDSRGFTLYHVQGETTSDLKCSGGCLSTWPPLLDDSGARLVAGAGVTGTLSTFSLSGGDTQVAYNGMPLYTFVGDSAPGRATGQGVENFFAVTPSMSGTAGGATSSPPGY
jgi:predicted lipoprotein with Yx(FWY)xxD motif